MDDNVAFMYGMLTATAIFIIAVLIKFSITNTENEFVEIRYQNKAGGASKQLVENMVKNQFPSNTWVNVDCKSSSTYVEIRLANP